MFAARGPFELFERQQEVRIPVPALEYFFCRQRLNAIEECQNARELVRAPIFSPGRALRLSRNIDTNSALAMETALQAIANP